MADEPILTETSTTETTAQTETAAVETPAVAATEAAVTASAAESTEEMSSLANAGDDPKPAEGEAEAAKTAEVPEAYELTVPEGFQALDPDAIAAATPVFKELGLSNEQANKLMPVVGEYAKRIVEQRDQQILATILQERKNWFEQAKAAPDIGGQNWDETMRLSAVAMDRLGFPKGSGFRTALEETGFEFNPDMIRFVSRVGKAIGEDSDFVRSDANAQVKKSDAELFYPTSKG